MCRIVIVALLMLTAACPAANDEIMSGGTWYRTFVTSPQVLDLHWRDRTGTPYRDFATLQAALTAEGKSIKFLMNAGIFEENGIPSGLLIINGKILKPLATQEGKGNFYLKPNGVFWVDSSGAHVASTEEYAALAPKPRIATQSGPLLLRNGAIHPAFKATSENRLHRNGVGIRKDGSVLFVITIFRQDHRPNLHEFASFFLAQGCADALFLDGDLSQMEVDVKDKLPPGNCFGAIFAVTETLPADDRAAAAKEAFHGAEDQKK